METDNTQEEFMYKISTIQKFINHLNIILNEQNEDEIDKAYKIITKFNKTLDSDKESKDSLLLTSEEQSEDEKSEQEQSEQEQSEQEQSEDEQKEESNSKKLSESESDSESEEEKPVLQPVKLFPEDLSLIYQNFINKIPCLEKIIVKPNYNIEKNLEIFIGKSKKY